MDQHDGEKVRQRVQTVYLACLVWFVCLVFWLNETNR